jgi:hypothetical protein
VLSDLERTFNLRLQIFQQREQTQTFGDETDSMPLSLNLQANHVGFKVWQEGNYVEADMDATLESLEGTHSGACLTLTLQ